MAQSRMAQSRRGLGCSDEQCPHVIKATSFAQYLTLSHSVFSVLDLLHIEHLNI